MKVNPTAERLRCDKCMGCQGAKMHRAVAQCRLSKGPTVKGRLSWRWTSNIFWRQCSTIDCIDMIPVCVSQSLPLPVLPSHLIPGHVFVSDLARTSSGLLVNLCLCNINVQWNTFIGGSFGNHGWDPRIRTPTPSNSGATSWFTAKWKRKSWTSAVSIWNA